MLNKMLEIMLTIGSFIGLFVLLHCAIQMVICDYEMWKRKKAEKERYHQLEDKFKNRKLTD